MRRKGMARREAKTRERMATRERRTRRGKTRSRRWKRRYNTIRPRKEALPLMRWDLSFLYHFLISFSTVKAYDVVVTPKPKKIPNSTSN